MEIDDAILGVLDEIAPLGLTVKKLLDALNIKVTKGRKVTRIKPVLATHRYRL